MVRYWPVVLMVLLPLTASVAQGGGKNDKEIKIEGKLTRDDPKDKNRGTASNVHLIKMKAGKVYTIDMVSTDLDSYLRLEDKKGTQLDEDDDSGGSLNARIVFNCSKDDEYRVICTCFAEATGKYVLTVKTKISIVVKPAVGQGLLVGKAAPDFQSDFALNGKAGKLSDHKGKIVLLVFWDVRSEACHAALPRLASWNKAYKADGLEVVGVSFYTSEIGQRIGFDPESGKLKTIDKASPETEQAMLKAYAAYHKLEHLLLTLHKDDAVKAFDSYVVNGVPLAVLIDRQGIIRMISPGPDEKTAANVEAEIKKLLAEK